MVITYVARLHSPLARQIHDHDENITGLIDSQMQQTVAANCENDTCFGNRLVMGLADCIIYAGLDPNP